MGGGGGGGAWRVERGAWSVLRPIYTARLCRMRQSRTV